MQNPFAKPHTLPQWLLASLCWVAGCLLIFCGCSRAAFALFSSEGISLVAVFGSAIVVCFLMWQRVIATGWGLVGEANAKSVARKVVARLAGFWLFLLITAFVVSVVLIAFGALICLALSGDSQTSWN